MKLGEGIRPWIRITTATAVGLAGIYGIHKLSPPVRAEQTSGCYRVYLPLVAGGEGLPPSDDNVLVFQCNEPSEPNPTAAPLPSHSPTPDDSVIVIQTNEPEEENPIEQTPNVGSTDQNPNDDPVVTTAPGDSDAATQPVNSTDTGDIVIPTETQAATSTATATDDLSTLPGATVVVFTPQW